MHEVQQVRASRLMRDAVRGGMAVRVLAAVLGVVAVHAMATSQTAATLATAGIVGTATAATALAVVSQRTVVGTSQRVLEGIVWLDLFKYIVLAVAVDPAAEQGVWLLGLIATSEMAAIRGPRTSLVGWAALSVVVGAVAVLERGSQGLAAVGLLGWVSLLTLGPTAFAAYQAFLVGKALDATHRARRQLAAQATTDELTGLRNRRGLLQCFAEQPPIGSYHVLFLDLDGFKAINDTLGHEAGDDALRAVASRLERSCPEGAVVCRLAGDEFAVLAHELDEDDVVATVARIRAAVAEPIELRGVATGLGASIGVARGRAGVALVATLDAADALMYAEKQGMGSNARDGRTSPSLPSA